MENKVYEFKDIATIDVAESVSESAHVLVEDGGVIKRLSKEEVGGGVKSWNDLTDKPFYEEETVVTETIIDDVVAITHIGEVYGHIFYGYDLTDVMSIEPNSKYKVAIDGGEYVCEPKYNEDLMLYFLGNGKFFDVEDSGEPFFISELPCNGKTYSCGIAIEEQSEAKNLHIEVTSVEEIVKPLDEKFIPDSMKPLVINGTLTATDGSPTFTVSDIVSYNDVKGALLLGRRVVLIVNDTSKGDTQIFPANTIYDNFIDFNNTFAGYAIQLKNNNTWGMA